MNEALKKLRSKAKNKALYKVSEDELKEKLKIMLEEYDETTSIEYEYRNSEYMRMKGEMI